jgi:Phosphoesterase family
MSLQGLRPIRLTQSGREGGKPLWRPAALTGFSACGKIVRSQMRKQRLAAKIVDQVEASSYAKDTAIFITFDEGGGYYDSGYVQALDFFGNGTRIPLIVVSPHAKPGYISHECADHVSIIKFIERNWRLPTITDRSRDNFPNPIAESGNPYVPVTRSGDHLAIPMCR